MRRVVQGLILFLINLYQCLLSPLKQACCRFYPSCSNYALLAIKEHGVVKGTFLAVYRVIRCNPWSYGGYDPVLPKKEKL